MKRIRELAEQTREYATTRHPVSNITLSVNSDLFEQKFAELIVQECAKVAYKYTESSVYNDDYDDVGWECLPGDLRTHIKQHFGVKE